MKNTHVTSTKPGTHVVYGLAVVLLLGLLLIGNLWAQVKEMNRPQSNAEQMQVAQVGLTKGEDYIIGPDDLLNIYILDVPELSRDYRVSVTGAITLPVLANPLNAAGLTLSQFSNLLSQELKTQGLVSDPHITMSVNQSRLHSVAIVGAVKHPQVYPLFSRTTLLDSLSEAEGLADDAGNVVIVHHGEVGVRALQLGGGDGSASLKRSAETLTIDLKKLMEGTDPSLNILIYPGDRITVPRAGVVYVIGAVNRPGGFTMNATSHEITVLQALALAQDATGTAKREQTMIIRNDPQAPEGKRQIPVNLKAILQGKSPDQRLQAEDILFVPDSGAKRAFHRGIESVVQAATGVAVYGGARF